MSLPKAATGLRQFGPESEIEISAPILSKETHARLCSQALRWPEGSRLIDVPAVVPDLRGMGLSAHPDEGYTKKNEAADIAGIMDALNIKTADLVTRDIGNTVG
jgi:pimeloyl-ACP methyl ester carboxylesterase